MNDGVRGASMKIHRVSFGYAVTHPEQRRKI